MIVFNLHTFVNPCSFNLFANTGPIPARSSTGLSRIGSPVNSRCFWLVVDDGVDIILLSSKTNVNIRNDKIKLKLFVATFTYYTDKKQFKYNT